MTSQFQIGWIRRVAWSYSLDLNCQKTRNLQTASCPQYSILIRSDHHRKASELHTSLWFETTDSDCPCWTTWRCTFAWGSCSTSWWLWLAPLSSSRIQSLSVACLSLLLRQRRDSRLCTVHFLASSLEWCSIPLGSYSRAACLPPQYQSSALTSHPSLSSVFHHANAGWRRLACFQPWTGLRVFGLWATRRVWT